MNRQRLNEITYLFNMDEDLTNIENIFQNEKWKSDNEVPFSLTHFELKQHYSETAAHCKIPTELNEAIFEVIKNYHSKLKKEINSI